ncbi:MAG: PcfB family protein [Clostridia bacterium]|nr:PcfB family protein [Clostridia bacterium]
MQEEVDSRTVALVINTAKLTGRIFIAAIRKFLEHQSARKQQKSTVIPHGKQSVKQLIGQNQGVTSIESNDPNIKAFEKVARKYGVDYAIKKVRDENGKHKYIIFFKGRDNDAITAAFREYTAKAMEKAKKPSILKKLQDIGAVMQNQVKERTKEKKREQTR